MKIEKLTENKIRVIVDTEDLQKNNIEQKGGVLNTAFLFIIVNREKFLKLYHLAVLW